MGIGLGSKVKKLWKQVSDQKHLENGQKLKMELKVYYI